MVVEKHNDLNGLLKMPNDFYVVRVNTAYTETSLEKVTLPIYPRFAELTEKLFNATLPIKAKDVRDWGFSDLVDEFDPYMKYYYYGCQTLQLTNRIDDKEDIEVCHSYNGEPYPDLQSIFNRVLIERIRLYLDNVSDSVSIIGCNYNLSVAQGEKQIADHKIKAFWDCLDYIKKQLNDERLEYNILTDDVDIDKHVYGIKVIVEDKPFVHLLLKLAFILRMRHPIASFDRFKWKLDFQSSLPFVYHLDNCIRDKYNSLEDIYQDIFYTPSIEDRQKVAEQINKSFSEHISISEVRFDFMTESFMLSSTCESKQIESILPKKASNEVKEVAKYTTLCTLLNMIKGNSIWMNSLVAMNDKTETEFLPDLIKNFDDEEKSVIDSILMADRMFITSLTSKIDNLDMWRLYGDNARGVCLVFERQKSDDLYEIKYVNPESEVLNLMKSTLNELKKQSIKFTFRQFEKNRFLIKHNDYSTEEEYRVLFEGIRPTGWFVNESNSILTPYIEKKIFSQNNAFPLKLIRIIVGPAMVEALTNVGQLYYMWATCYNEGMEFRISEITSYR